MMKKTFKYMVLALFLCACQSLRPEKVEIVTLGVVPDDVVVAAEAGEGSARVIADRDYQVEVLSGADWLFVTSVTREAIGFSYRENTGFRRSASVKVSADGREDVLLVKQEGPLQEMVQLSEHNRTVPSAGETVRLRVLSNLPSDFFLPSASNDKAIVHLQLADYQLSFDVLPTTNRDKRTYTVNVTYTDGWGDIVSDSMEIQQLAYDN